MRQIVKCLNCELIWERITPEYDGERIELTSSLMYNCPNCNSNYYESAQFEQAVKELDAIK